MAKSKDSVVLEFLADTAPVTKAQRDLRAAFEAMAADNKRLNTELEKLGNTGGRTASAVEAMIGPLKGVAARWLSFGSVASLALNTARGESERVSEELKTLTAEAQRSSSAISLMGRSSSLGQLSAEFKASYEQGKKLREMLGDRQNDDPAVAGLREMGDLWTNYKEFAAHPRPILAGQPTGAESQSTDRFQAVGQNRQAQAQLLNHMSTVADLQKRIAADELAGNTDAVKRLRAELDMEREIFDLKRAEVKDESILTDVRKRFADIQATIKRDRDNAARFAESELGVQQDLIKGQAFLAAQNALTLKYEREITAIELAGGKDAEREINALKEKLQIDRSRLTTQQGLDRFRMDSEKRAALYNASNASDVAKTLDAARAQLALLEKEDRLREVMGVKLTEQEQTQRDIQKLTAQTAEIRALQQQGANKTWSQIMSSLVKEREGKRRLDVFDRGQGPALAKARRDMGLDAPDTNDGAKPRPGASDMVREGWGWANDTAGAVRKKFGWANDPISKEFPALYGYGNVPGVMRQESDDPVDMTKWNGLASSGLRTGGLVTGDLGGTSLAESFRRREPNISAGQMLQKTAGDHLKEAQSQTAIFLRLEQKLDDVILR